MSTAFTAESHGFRFRNSFSLGRLHFGLCGGMAFAALDRFYDGTPPPRTITPPRRGSPLFRELLRRQIDSFRGLKVPAKVLRWQRWSDLRLISHTLWNELPRITNALAAGHPVVLCLIRAERRESPTHNHQVLATGFVKDGLGTAIKVYDPNYPVVTNELWIGNDGRMRQLTGEKLRGFFVIEYEREIACFPLIGSL